MTALAHVQGPRDTPLRDETIGLMWDRAAATHVDRLALVSRHQGIRWSYEELAAHITRCARALLAAGVDKGDRVGIWSANNVEWVIVQLATAKIGAILVNINPAYRTHELEYALTQSGCSLLILAPHFRGTDYVQMLGEVDTPQLTRSVVLGEQWQELLQGASHVDAETLAAREAELSPDDPINIQYTSGTTGFPKGATLSHRNILNNGFFVGETLGYTEADRACVPVPFYHCFGMVLGNLAAFTHGACVVLPDEAFDAGRVLEAIAEERCTALLGVPTMFIAELEHSDFATFDVTSLRTGVMAGSPCPVEVMKRVQNEMHMNEVTICYGMTETSPVSTQTPRDASLQKRVSTVGIVHPQVEVKIIDPNDGRTVDRGVRGELCTTGYSVMLGYWQNDEATGEAIDADGWMHSGDLAVMDDDGYVNIVGRIKDMIIRGGENIYPREIEEFLHTHPDIQDVQVIGVPDERYGEVVCAWIILHSGAELDEDAIADFCRGRIAHYKVPRYVRFVDSFPVTVTGKVQKFVMREHEVKERGLATVETA
jgi:fatty-acyl-CoA synthase